MKNKANLVGVLSSGTLSREGVTVTVQSGASAMVCVKKDGGTEVSVQPPKGKSQQGETLPPREIWDSSFISKLLPPWLRQMVSRLAEAWILKHM